MQVPEKIVALLPGFTVTAFGVERRQISPRRRPFRVPQQGAIEDHSNISEAEDWILLRCFNILQV
jgi:hypothetical protein